VIRRARADPGQPYRYGPFVALGVVAACTIVGWFSRPWFATPGETSLIFILGLLWTASRLPQRDALLGAVASVAAFDFFFVPPVLGFVPSDGSALLTLVAFLTTSFVVSGYAASIRSHVEDAVEQERRTAALYALSRALSAQGEAAGIAAMAARRVTDLLGVDAEVFLPDPRDGVVAAGPASTTLATSAAERAVARRVLETSSPCELRAESEGGGEVLHLPMISSRRCRGVLAVALGQRGRPISAAQRTLLETFATLTAVALERAALAEDAENARIAVETERTRSTLLSAVSHDLRTPLASITGAAGALLAPGSSLDDEGKRDLVAAIRDEGDRLGRLVANLLDLTRVGAGGAALRREWYAIEELVASAMGRVRPRLEPRSTEVEVPKEVLLVRVDGVLFEQVVVNLLENAVRHTPPGTPIAVRVRATATDVVVEVLDRGPGIAPAKREEIFAPFHRPSSETAGAGLGLALCRAIVRAHGGTIVVDARPQGGAVFRVTIPRETAPEVRLDDERDD
jgi:two-component system sensor histidine kinase KdpD